jgi:HPr kinase/phosphorylase
MMEPRATRPQVSVEAFFEHVERPLALNLVAGRRGMHRLLKSARIQKPGLALAGYSAFVHPDRVQILGQTELSYVASLPPEVRERSVAGLTALNLACILVTKNLPLPDELIAACERTSTPLFRTAMTSSECIRKVLAYLDDLLSPRCRVHGVLVDIDGVGVLITGASGIGKSECALELVERGHRLVADDVVEIRRRGEDLVGQAAKIIQDLIEIRGLGILNVAELFGVAATRDHKKIEIRIELEEWRSDAIYDRVGLEEHTYDILGRRIRSILLPVRPGRNMAGIIEVAARNFLLRLRGHHAPLALNSRIHRNVHGDEGEVQEIGQPSSPDLITGEVPSLFAAAELAEVTDHIEDEVE